MLGKMVECTKENGAITKCMEREYLTGLMAENIKEIIQMIKSMDLEHSNSKMEESIRVNGIRESSTEGESSERET